MSGDLLNSLMNAAGSQSGSGQSGGDPLSALLGGLMGGGGAQGAQGGDVLGGLLGGLMGGGGAPSAQQGAGDLGSLMGGGGAAGAQGAGDLGSLMGGGGAQGAQGGDVLGGLLGGLLGGGVPQGGQQMPTAQAGISSHPFLAPIVNGLAQKLGLPPAIAEVVVSFALTQLLNSLMSRASTGGAPGMQSPAGSQRAGEGAGDLQMEDIAQRFQSGQAIDAKYLRSAGLSQQLADQTGLDHKTAAASLEQAFQLLGGALGSEQ